MLATIKLKVQGASTIMCSIAQPCYQEMCYGPTQAKRDSPPGLTCHGWRPEPSSRQYRSILWYRFRVWGAP